MKSNLLKLFVGVSALALTLTACNGSIDDTKSLIESIISNYSGGEDTKPSNDPVSSDGKTSDSSSAGGAGNSSSAGGQGGTSSSQGGQVVTDKYQVTADFWNNYITNLGIFGNDSNITLNGEQKAEGKVVADILVEANNGDIHMKAFNNEAYLDFLADGGVDIYTINEQSGKWEKDNLPAAFAGSAKVALTEIIQPFLFSDFTYNASSHAYEKASYITHPDAENPNYIVQLSAIEFKFEDNKLISHKYDATADGKSGTVSLTASKWGTTSFTFPTPGSQGAEPHGGGGEGETPVDINNPFYKVELKYDGIISFDAVDTTVTQAQIEAKYASLKLSLFPDGSIVNNNISDAPFELYMMQNNAPMALIGTFVANQNEAQLNTRVMYDGTKAEYSFNVYDKYKEVKVYRNSTNNFYILEFEELDSQGAIKANFILRLVLSSNNPVYLDRPQEPIDDAYTVNYDQWKDIFENHKLLTRTSNFTVKSTGLYNENNLLADNGKILVESKSQFAPDNVTQQYYEALKDDMTEYSYYYFDTTDEIWKKTDLAPFNNISFFDDLLGVFPFKYADFTYYPESRYYFCNKFTYKDEYEYEHVLNKVHICFENKQLKTLDYTDEYQQKHIYEYSLYGTTSVTLPIQGETHYEDDFANKVFEFNRIESSNANFDTSSLTFNNSTMSFFGKNDNGIYGAEWVIPSDKLFVQNGGELAILGHYQGRKEPVTKELILTLYAEDAIIDGVHMGEGLDSTDIHYLPDSQELAYKESGYIFTNAQGKTEQTNLVIFYKLSNKTPSHYVVPTLPNNWNADAVESALENIEVTSGSIPALSYVKEFGITSKSNGFTISCEMPSSGVAGFALQEFKNSLSKDYISVYAEDYSTIIGYKPISNQFQFAISQDDKTIEIDVIKLESALPDLDYPSESIEAFLTANNISDSVPSFKKIKGSTYFMFTSFDENESGMLYVLTASEDDVQAALASAVKILTDANYKVKTVGDQVLYVSANEQLAIKVSTFSSGSGIQINFLNGSVASQTSTTYPKAKVDAFLKANNIDGDPMPDLPTPEGDYSSFDPESGSIFVGTTEAAGNAALTNCIKVLKDNGFSEVEVFGQKYYVSPNKISFVVFTTMSYGDSYFFAVAFGNANTIPSADYPTRKISTYLQGARDNYPSFATEGYLYLYEEPYENENEWPNATLSILLTNEQGSAATDIEALVSVLTSERYNYVLSEEMTVIDNDDNEYYFNNVYVGPNSNIAISFEANDDDNGIAIRFFNLAKFKEVSFGEPEEELSIVDIAIGEPTKGFLVGEEFMYDDVATIIYSDGTEVAAYSSDFVITAPDMTTPGEKEVVLTYTDEAGLTYSVSYFIDVIDLDDDSGEDEGEDEETTYTFYLINNSENNIEERYVITYLNDEEYYLSKIDDIDGHEAFELIGVPASAIGSNLTLYVVNEGAELIPEDPETYVASTTVRLTLSAGGMGGEVNPEDPISLQMVFANLPEYVAPDF